MGGIFGGGTSVNTSEKPANGVQIQTSVYGNAVPLVFGRTRVTGNLIWYEDFKAHAHTTTTSSGKGGGGGESSSTTYTYSCSFCLMLSEGVVTDLVTFWAGKTKLDGSILTDKNSDVTDTITDKTGTSRTTSPTGSKGSRSHATGGNKGGVTPESSLSLMKGQSPQAEWPYIVTKHPNQSLAYPGFAYLAAENYDLGDTASLPAMSFEIVGINANAAFGSLGANPADIITTLLTNTRYGAMFPAGKIASLTNYGNYVGALGLYMSPAYTEQQTAAQAVTDIVELTNSGIYFSEGVIKVVPYGDEDESGNGYTYTAPTSTLINLCDDDFIVDGPDDNPVLVRRNAIPTTGSTSSDAYNQVGIEYLNRLNEYNVEVVTVQDQAAIETFGLIPMDTVTAHHYTDPTAVHAAASLILQRKVYIRNQYEFRLGWNYAYLEPTDMVTLTDSALGLDAKPVRILIVEEDEEGTISITAEDAPPGAASRVVRTPQSGVGYSANYNSPVGDVLTPLFFEPPVDLVTGRDDVEVWVGLTGQAGDTDWGGADVYVSMDGSTFKYLGTTNAPARIGHLTATMGSTASVQLDGIGGQLLGGSAAGAAALATLSCIVDGAPEFFAYTTATLTGANAYDLTGLVRGAYSFPKGSHVAGAKFVRVDDAIVKGNGVTSDMIGVPIYFKFCSFNVWGGAVQDLADVIPYVYTPTGVAVKAYAANWNPSNSMFSAIAVDRTVKLSWSTAQDKTVDGYEIRVGASWAAGTVVVSGLAADTFNWTPTLSGTLTFWLKAIIAPGVYSDNAAQVVLSVTPPSISGLTQQVIDNNALLYWGNVAGTYAFDHVEVKKGNDYATAVLVGKLSGSFATIFETAAGTYKYWVTPFDAAGLAGTPVGIYAIINQPPDYILRSQGALAMTGTCTNVVINGGILYAPMNNTETFQQHFTSHSYTSPQDQVNAGFPYYPQPAPASGTYVETIDYGASIASSKISLTLTRETIVGNVTVTPTIQTSPDNSTWTTYAGVYECFGTNFRYVKITLAFSTSDSGFVRVTGTMVRLDVKLKTYSGTGAAVAGDSGGTAVDITGQFIDVSSITVTPQGTTSITGLYDFTDIPNPTSFKVLLFNTTTGARVSGSFSFTVRGV